jgi:signal transduction histidine kinase
VVAHDLRNPLASIAGYTDFLREDAAAGLSAEQRGFAGNGNQPSHDFVIT